MIFPSEGTRHGVVFWFVLADLLIRVIKEII